MKRELSLLSAALLAATAAPAWAATSADERCAALQGHVMQAARVNTARVVDAAEDKPAYCEVRATALPAINIEVRLPLEGWNGKLYQTGCGGFCGDLGRADRGDGFINAMGPGLARGYATATSDSGHHGLSVLDADWAYNNPQAERDWGWRSIGETNRVAGELMGAFYDGDVERSYFQGCSTGGRMAQRAALQYPDMFDGIISGAPALDYPGLVATKFSWIVQANTDADGNPILKAGKEALIGDEVMAQCDAVDGVEDGVITDPRACNVDLSVLQCTGAPGGDCLTADELAVIAKWRQGPRDSSGNQLYPGGVPEGSEPFWGLWLTKQALAKPFAQSFGRFMAFDEDPGPLWTPANFDFDTDPARMGVATSMYNSDNPDVSDFIDAGGKMIVWHGWADPLVTPYKTVEWYQKAADVAGGEDVLAQNVRLFMIPGMDHCGLQPGPGGIHQSKLTVLEALENWVEGGTAPTSVVSD